MHPTRLPWPASRIDRDVLHELWLMSQEQGKPITLIIADAVHRHLNQQFDDHRVVAESAAKFQVFSSSAPSAA